MLIIPLFTLCVQSSASTQFGLGCSVDVLGVHVQHYVCTQKTRGAEPMLILCWASVADSGQTLNQHLLTRLFAGITRDNCVPATSIVLIMHVRESRPSPSWIRRKYCTKNNKIMSVH